MTNILVFVVLPIFSPCAPMLFVVNPVRVTQPLQLLPVYVLRIGVPFALVQYTWIEGPF
jgi:hypothetical protein